MDIRLSVDVKRWEAAIDRYAKVAKKSQEEALLHQTRNLCFFLGKRVKEEAIKRPTDSWFIDLSDGSDDACRLTAWLLRRAIEKGVVNLPGRGEMEDGKRVFRRYKTRGKGGGKMKAEYYRGGKYYTRKFAKQWARKNTRQRRAARGFSVLLPYKAAEEVVRISNSLGYRAKLGRMAKPKPNQRNAGEAFIAFTRSGGRSRVQLRSRYTYKRPYTYAMQPSAESAGGYETLLRRHLPGAYKDAIADIEVYIRRKMEQNAKKMQKS